jgi:predicted Zn-dependent peptidase
MIVDQAVYQRTVLPNGLVVLTEPMDHVRTASLGVWIPAGSRYEDEGRMGVSHFIEHALFKGTTSRSALRIAQAMDAIGGHLNAFTDKEHTCYYLRVLSEHLDTGMELLADMLLHPALDPAALERERQVILEEINMYEDSPEDLVHDLFAATLWPGHPLGWPISGTQASVAGLRRDDLLEFMGARYRPDASIVAAAGKVRHERVVEIVAQRLGAWDGRLAATTLRPPTPGHAIAFRSKDIEQVHLCLGAPAIPQAHPDRYIVSVLDTALGGGMSSRLFQEIREERGLAYAITSYHAAYLDAGAFVVYAATSPEASGEVVRLTLAELGRVRRELSEEEVSRAKECLKGSLMLDLETPESRMSKLARSEQYFGRQITLDEIIAEVDAVTRDDVRRVADALLLPERLTLVAIGPFDQHPGLADALDQAVHGGGAAGA